MTKLTHRRLTESSMQDRAGFNGSYEEMPAHEKLGIMSVATRLAQKRRMVMRTSKGERDVEKWVHLWRTIILSSLGKTLYPYSQYLRKLNLRDLELLLVHLKSKDEACK